ncbi:MAG: hypothetical protein AABX34_07230 [Nanoarchaeota archaeon]
MKKENTIFSSVSRPKLFNIKNVGKINMRATPNTDIIPENPSAI